MKNINNLFKNCYLLFILISLIYFFFLINCNNICLLKINYFSHDNKLYYVNAINSESGDIYMEFWGEQNNFRYFIGINSTTEEEILFGNKTILKIESNSPSTFHESIIIDTNEEINIFSMNYKSFDFINIKSETITSKKTYIILDKNSTEALSFKNSIIKLNSDNHYLLSFYLKYEITSIFYLRYIFIIFSFTSNNIMGYNEIKRKPMGSDSTNSTNCFQTESEYIQISYLNNNLFIVGIFDLDLNKVNEINFNPSHYNTFSKIFHIKGEIGAYLYFNLENIPIIHIKKLNEDKNLENIFNFESITLNGNGKYNINPGLFYSDAIKINNYKFVVIMTSQNLLNIISY